ncbi:hypothetical protein ME9_00329 [Bartonella taylorii 8TBB]|uniref:Uncharacterized protein n=1 Tax=Bartonella taylorii 8TBB TaxID=1094560 RepID=A0A9P2S108_BARTA|nr:hypothetical protein ME9_00329 [Bartonella taylorii 8TBB]OPB35210.1 hypothetical protein Btaycd_007290 [Bartonella taylorii]
MVGKKERGCLCCTAVQDFVNIRGGDVMHRKKRMLFAVIKRMKYPE